MEKVTLQEELKKLEDKRRGQGRRHSIDLVLMLTIMATMSRFFGYRAIGDFAVRYKDELIKYLKPSKDRLPAYATVRRVLKEIDSNAFGAIFTRWMEQYLQKEDEAWISIDGKAIRGTKQKEEDKKLAHLVSFFKNDSKEVIIARQTASKSNEIPLVQEMLKEFSLEKMILTLDALHCQTETLAAIIESKNDYVVQVKGNQKKTARTT